MGRTIYAVYHAVCGHIAGLPNERWMGERFIEVLAAKGQHLWRIRAGASDADYESLLRGDRCALCQQDEPQFINEGTERA